MNESEHEAYERGIDSPASVRFSDNPYRRGTREYEQWKRGKEDAAMSDRANWNLDEEDYPTVQES